MARVGDSTTVLMFSHSSSEYFFPDIQPEPPLKQLEAVSPCPVINCMGEEAKPCLWLENLCATAFPKSDVLVQSAMRCFPQNCCWKGRIECFGIIWLPLWSGALSAHQNIREVLVNCRGWWRTTRSSSEARRELRLKGNNVCNLSNPRLRGPELSTGICRMQNQQRVRKIGFEWNKECY